MRASAEQARTRTNIFPPLSVWLKPDRENIVIFDQHRRFRFNTTGLSCRTQWTHSEPAHRRHRRRIQRSREARLPRDQDAPRRRVPGHDHPDQSEREEDSRSRLLCAAAGCATRDRSRAHLHARAHDTRNGAPVRRERRERGAAARRRLQRSERGRAQARGRNGGGRASVRRASHRAQHERHVQRALLVQRDRLVRYSARPDRGALEFGERRALARDGSAGSPLHRLQHDALGRQPGRPPVSRIPRSPGRGSGHESDPFLCRGIQERPRLPRCRAQGDAGQADRHLQGRAHGGRRKRREVAQRLARGRLRGRERRAADRPAPCS